MGPNARPARSGRRSIVDRLGSCLLFGILAFAGPAGADVRIERMVLGARLDGEGVLWVMETLEVPAAESGGTIRRFLPWWPPVHGTIESVVRLDGSGEEIALDPGPAPTENEFFWSLEHGVQWVTPSEASTAPWTYRLRYRVAGVFIPMWGARAPSGEAFVAPFVTDPLRRLVDLRRQWAMADGTWTRRVVLDYDFLGGGSDGSIDRLVLDLALAPEWVTTGPARLEATSLLAESRFAPLVVLDWTGSGPPAGVDRWRAAARWLGLAVVPIGGLLLWGLALARAAARRRRVVAGPVDERWLVEHVLSTPPEPLLPAPDDVPSVPSAAEVLEGLVADGRIERDDPLVPTTLTLVANEHDLSRRERVLVGELFAGGREADRADVQRRVREESLDLDGAVHRVVTEEERRAGLRSLARSLPVLLVAGLGLVLLFLEAKEGAPPPLFFAVVTAGVLDGFLRPIARRVRQEPGGSAARVVLLALPVLLYGVGLPAVLLTLVGGWKSSVGTALLWLAHLSSLFRSTCSLETPEAERRRFELSAAHDHFEAELRKKRPDLDDAWLPWILAAGLGKKVAQWRKRWGAEAAGRWHGGTEPPGSRWAEHFLGVR